MRLMPGRRPLTVADQVPIPVVVLGDASVKVAFHVAATPLTRTERVRIASERPVRATVLAVTCGYPFTSAGVEVTASLRGMRGTPLAGAKMEVMRSATNCFIASMVDWGT